MTDQDPIESILAADIGSTLTHACLIDKVGGAYRLVARAETPTTLSEPENDLMIGLRRAIRRLEQTTQRFLLDGDGELISPESESGSGVDRFVATSSAARPLGCVIIGLTDALSVESALHACAAANVTVSRSVALGARMRRWDDQTLAMLHDTPPEVLIIAGGVDTAPSGPIESAARVLATLYADVDPESRPVIVFAGNQEARRPISAVLASAFDFRVVDNVRPSVHVESLNELQRELADIYERIKLAQLPGYRRLRLWCATPVLSTIEALSKTWRFVARRDQLPQGLLGVDVGGLTTYVGAVHGSSYQWAVGASLGVSHGIQRAIEMSGIDDIDRWLPVSLDKEDLVNRLENARLRPNSVPQTMEDLFLVHAVLRQAVLLTMRKMRQQYWYQADSAPEEQLTPAFDLILMRGGALGHTPQDGVLVLSILDALQPVGLCRLALDWASIWPQLGAVATVAPAAAAQVLGRDSICELGTVVAPIGEAREGESALSIKLEREDGQTTEMTIPAGTVRRIPLADHQRAVLEVRPSVQFDIGLNRKGWGGRAQVRGGRLGIIVDTRGRPLTLSRDEHYRRAKLQEWLGNLIGDANE